MALKRLLSIFVAGILCLMNMWAKAEDFTVDDNGNVVFTATVSDLKLNDSEIYNAAREYCGKAYKITKYKVSNELPEKGILVAQGKVTAFYQHSNLTSTTSFSVNFYLRIDAKDGRARIQFIADKYEFSQNKDIGKSKADEVQVSKCEPVSTYSEYKGKPFHKAFAELTKLSEKVLDEVTEKLKSTASSTTIEEEDW